MEEEPEKPKCECTTEPCEAEDVFDILQKCKICNKIF
jgi:hypothetical protein